MQAPAQQLYTLLQEHAGLDQAITVGELEAHMGIPARQIRRLLQQFVIAERIPVGTTVHPPYGVYLITTIAEARECLHQYAARIRSLARRAKALRQVVQERFGIDVQLELDFHSAEETTTDDSNPR